MNPSIEPMAAFWTSDERDAWQETEDWLNASASRFNRLLSVTRKPIEYAYSKVPETLRESIASTIFSVLSTVRDGTADLVSTSAVLDRLGPQSHSPDGHLALGVRAVDDVAKSLISSSKNACTAEGAATGMAGLPGIVVDIPALYGLLFRMIAQVAACYGFPVETDEDERFHLLKILDVGHLQQPDERRGGMEELLQWHQSLGNEVAVFEAQRFAVEKGLQNLARQLGLALTQRKLAQTVALVGSVVGAGVNRQLAGEVGQVAFHAYRRRFLLETARRRQSDRAQNPQPVSDSQPSFCSNCGHFLIGGVRFCTTCGEKVPSECTQSPADSPDQPTIEEATDNNEFKVSSPPGEVDNLFTTALVSNSIEVEPAPMLSPLQRTAHLPGKARLQVDAEELNLLLSELASESGMSLRFEAGQVFAQTSNIRATLTHLPLEQTAITVGSAAASLHIEIETLTLQAEGVEASLRLGIELS